MPFDNTLRIPAPAQSRLPNGQLLVSGLSSYRHSFGASLATLTCNDARKLSDEKWLSMLGSFLEQWFAFEEYLPCATDPLVLDVLHDNGLDELTYERFIGEMRPAPLRFADVPDPYENDPFP